MVPATGSSVTLASLSPSQPNIVVRSKWTAYYRAVVVRIGSKQISAVATSSDYDGVSAGGIRLGAPWPSVELAYGAPDRRQPFGSGACALYERPEARAALQVQLVRDRALANLLAAARVMPKS